MDYLYLLKVATSNDPTISQERKKPILTGRTRL